MLGLDFLKEYFELFWDYFKPWFLVFSYQEVVVLRAGKFHRVLKPGLYPKMMIFEYGMEINVKPDTMRLPPVEITTKDGKIICIGAYIEFYVEDARKFLIENNDAFTNAHDIASGKLSDTIEEIDWEVIKEKPTKTKYKNSIKDKFKNLGLSIMDVEFIEKCEINVYKVFGDNHSLLPVR